MRLIRAQFKNFKLLEDVRLEFSVDPQRPLTVIRAENGSGKTSVLWALLWGFYGTLGLPESARGLRITSAAIPPDTPVNVQVMVEFEHTDESGTTTRYRLVRTVTETTGSNEKIDRPNDRIRLLKITSSGEVDVERPEALIEKLAPLRLKDVFFTNGDDVQTFISGRVSSQQRQSQVHKLIKDLLGLDALRMAADDLQSVFKSLRSETAKSGGGNFAEATKVLEETDTKLAAGESRREDLTKQLTTMAEHKGRWEKELSGLRGIGDLDELNDRINSCKRETERLGAARSRTLGRMRELLRSEEFSWALMDDRLESGLHVLDDLADRDVIPGPSLEVLTDRLHLNLCICGEPLPVGSPRREAVERMRSEQQEVSQNRQRLTQSFHTARQSKAGHDGQVEEGRDFGGLRTKVLEEFTEARDSLAGNALELAALVERRKQIDEDRVRDLVDKIRKVEAQIADANTSLGTVAADVSRLQELQEEQRRLAREAERAVKLNDDLAVKRDVAEDLLKLAQGTLSVLEHDYVARVSTRMNELFMQIVGSHPDFEAGVFTGVHIAKNYDIVVDTHHDRRLDTDFELNGASQRALTLSFIWALMEVSGVTAPRIIDTPLGMIAGGVKTRMVDAITKPAGPGLPDFQVVLLLTRSEVRDVEDLLDQRAGLITTMSCSKDFPEDLVHSWQADHPLIKICRCNHHESCLVCARRYDSQHGIVFRNEDRTI